MCAKCMSRRTNKSSLTWNVGRESKSTFYKVNHKARGCPPRGEMGVQGAQRGWRLEVVGVRDMERLPVKGMGPWGSERSVDTPKRGGHSGSGSEAGGGRGGGGRRRGSESR